jgi:hypothetical protein
MDPVTPWRSERPLRNASPGDLRPRDGVPWPGQSHVEEGPEGRFAVFVTIVDGWGAYALWLREAFFVRRLRTARAIAALVVTPPAGMTREAYEGEVAGLVGEGELALESWATQVQALQAIMRWNPLVPVWNPHLLVNGLRCADATWSLFAPRWQAERNALALPAPEPVDG